VATLGGQAGGVDSVAFSPDGKYVAVGTRDDSAAIYDVKTGLERSRFRGHLSL
jgi:WD40 repeat protein